MVHTKCYDTNKDLTQNVRNIQMRTLIFLLINLTLIIPSLSFACSCMPYSPDPNKATKLKYKNSSTIVLAKVESVKQIKIDNGNFASAGEETHFSIIQSWKGNPEKDFRTKIVTDCCVCGITFSTGETYLLFLNGSEEKNVYTTSSCSGNLRLSQANKQIQILNRLSPNKVLKTIHNKNAG